VLLVVCFTNIPYQGKVDVIAADRAIVTKISDLQEANDELSPLEIAPPSRAAWIRWWLRVFGNLDC
jgi:hypothetical protein